MGELEDTDDHLVVIGRGKVIADTSVTDLIATASGNRITLHTTAPAEAMPVLASAAAEEAPAAGSSRAIGDGRPRGEPQPQLCPDRPGGFRRGPPPAGG